MKNLKLALCILALSAIGCAAGTDDPVAGDPEVGESVSTIQTESETCTVTEGPCRVGQCELGPHDTFQKITEVCCTPSGVCTTETYRHCGC